MPEPSPPIDLLNLNQQPSASAASAAADPLASAMPSSDASFDLLGAFGDDDSTGIGSAPIPDVLPPPQATAQQPKLNADLFDIFGSIDQSSGLGTPNLKPTTSTNLPPFVGAVPTFVTTPAAPRKEPSPTQPQKPVDPFADIANLASDLNINFNRNTLGSKSASTTPVGHSPQPTQFSSPIHRPTPSPPQNQSQIPQQQPMFGKPQAQPQVQPQPAFAKTSPHAQPQPQAAQSRPDYSRTHFDAPKTGQQAAGGGAKGSDIFADILGQQGYSFGSKMNQGPRSINEMRKEELVKDMDPKKVRIMEWVIIKHQNYIQRYYLIATLLP